ncbi:MAG TPA: hypothetical protein VHE81_18975 [Lacipirellulaceae bacterium]|nr:hypothetical protein [Lacipirellulaceae bacterium]
MCFYMERVADYRRPAFLMLVVATLVGCAPEVYGLRQNFLHPGPAAYQRAAAVQHDPYPLNDVGPEIVGGRPREYQIPLNEVERARLGAPIPPGLRPVPAPAVPSAPLPAGPAYPVTTAPAAPAAVPYPTTTAPAIAAPAPPTTPPATLVPAPQAAPLQVQPRAPY